MTFKATVLLVSLVSGCSPGGDRMTAETGDLSPRDLVLESGEYHDVYSVRLDAGQWIVMDLLTNAFDPYLILREPGGDQTENDDARDQSADRSRIVYRAEEGGTYELFVTSYEAGEVGPYAVVWDVTDAPPAGVQAVPAAPPGHPGVPDGSRQPPVEDDVFEGGVRI